MAPGSPLPHVAIGGLVLALAGAIWRIGPALPFHYALAGAIAASVFVPGHVYTHDYLLVIPLVLCFFDSLWPKSVAEAAPADLRPAVTADAH
jgi:hypothetical protein